MKIQAIAFMRPELIAASPMMPMLQAGSKFEKAALNPQPLPPRDSSLAALFGTRSPGFYDDFCGTGRRIPLPRPGVIFA